MCISNNTYHRAPISSTSALVNFGPKAMSASAPPDRPPTLFETYTYKNIGTIELKVDVHLPSTPYAGACPVILYIPGGGWIGCSRTDYSSALFHSFLSLCSIVCCINYRLLPETHISGLIDDVKSIESWIKEVLPMKMRDIGVEVDHSKIVVVGGSAGGHLALLTVCNP